MGKVSNVKCSVDECVYWGTGDVCEAESIEVKRNTRSHEGGAAGAELGRRDMEAGRMGDPGTRARKENMAWTSEHTMCRTFRPRPMGRDR
ncbi:MAG: DUF1540 domain-containing protein [Firmicutes bacterium]|nr:DUF1540 domain-containing protein [Bacillota bacterium]HXL04348.1 DUF1540 domain-containing protein [Bacillota bacterium]